MRAVPVRVSLGRADVRSLDGETPAFDRRQIPKGGSLRKLHRRNRLQPDRNVRTTTATQSIFTSINLVLIEFPRIELQNVHRDSIFHSTSRETLFVRTVMDKFRYTVLYVSTLIIL